MIKEFTADFKSHEVWKFGIALDLAAAGSGAAAVLFSLLYGLRSGVLVGLAMGCVGEAALFLDLGHRMRFWRAFAKGTRTWISLGTLANTGLLLSGALFFLVPGESLISVVIKIIALICSLTVMVYGASLLSSMGSIPFWRSSLLPVLFLGHSSASGIGIVVTILALAGQNMGSYNKEAPVAIALLLFTSLFTWLYTRRSASLSGAVRESVRLLTEGRLRGLFVGGAYLAGLLAPLVLTLLCFISPGSLGVTTTAGLAVLAIILRLVGDVSFRYSVLEAGIFEPVI